MAVPQKQAQEKGEAPTQTKLFREFRGVHTQAARVSIPQDTFYDLVNVIPIGASNLHSVPPPSAALASYGSDPVYWSQYANINSVDYLISFSTTGKMFAYNILTGVLLQIASGLSGSGSRFDQWKNQALLIIDTSGYFSWDGTTFAAVPTAGGSILPTFPLTGPVDIAVFGNRVYLYNKRLLYISGLNDFTGTAVTGGFQVVNGALIQNITDPQARGELTRLLSANGYLYLFFKSSVFVVSDVYIPTNAVPPAPAFTMLNIQANIGCDQPGSIFVVNRDLMFANRYGLWALRGVTADRISADIDGTIQYLDFSKAISGGTATVKNIQNAAFLINQLNDPVIGTRTVLALYFDQKWWFSNVGAVSFICQGIVNNTPVLFAFIANTLYQLFVPTAASPGAIGQLNFLSTASVLNGMNFVSTGGALQFQSAGANLNFQSLFGPGVLLQFSSNGVNLYFVSGVQALPASWQTALWPMEDQLCDKEVLRSGYEVTTAGPANITLNVDSATGSTPVTIGPVPGQLTFTTGGVPITFQSASGALNFTSPIYGLLFGDAGGVYGKYVGFSGTAQAGADFEISSFDMDYILRKRW